MSPEYPVRGLYLPDNPVRPLARIWSHGNCRTDIFIGAYLLHCSAGIAIAKLRTKLFGDTPKTNQASFALQKKFAMHSS